MLQQQTKTGEKKKKKHYHNWQKDRISQVRYFLKITEQQHIC